MVQKQLNVGQKTFSYLYGVKTDQEIRIAVQLQENSCETVVNIRDSGLLKIILLYGKILTCAVLRNLFRKDINHPIRFIQQCFYHSVPPESVVRSFPQSVYHLPLFSLRDLSDGAFRCAWLSLPDGVPSASRQYCHPYTICRSG